MTTAMNLVGAAIYLITTGMCLRVWKRPVQSLGSGPRHFWLMAATFFVFLSFLRIFNLQEAVRKAFKQFAENSGDYTMRRPFQADVLLAVALIGLLVAGIAAYRFLPHLRSSRSARWVALAAAGMAGHVMLLIVRIISLHAVDAVMYGPAKANLVLDAACTSMVIAAAWFQGANKKHVRRQTR